MFQEELKLPPKPCNTRTETNAEILRQLSRDLSNIYDLELSAIDGYRMFRHAGSDQPSWGYCLESARIENSEESLILFRRDEELHEDRFLDWVPLSSCYTLEQAKSCDVSYTGPSEEVLRAILELFRDVFEFALKTNWSYDKRIEFYHSFPFEELPSIRSVKAFRRTLFSCPAFDGFDWTFPEVEEIDE
eukprot:CAMPEP_0172424048 /NCGR_PEP_ID=MMETSP1064-20121228/20708_1 /TAXON_ID=202472 /ORGANISM="Aulacoseira subarctica , Strain CCAP 1002/5" /LENGTH=188 /DNA_ID=CAMNT_0013165777 /DNA_START=135 /DNA_END=701 /DNA_ORIENTATION=-